MTFKSTSGDRRGGWGDGGLNKPWKTAEKVLKPE